METSVPLHQLPEVFPARSSLLHSPSASIQRRTVLADNWIWSSPARCSAASVGPQRCPTSPEYFCWISRTTFARIFSGLARLEIRPCQEVLRLYQEKYFDLNVPYFHEKLKEEG